MKGEIRASISGVAAAVMLIACASKESSSSRSVDASTQETSAEYQRLADNVSQQLSCKKQTVLGSRVPTVVCVTQADLKAQREHADEVMHDLQANKPMNRQAPPPPPPSPER